MDCIDFTPKVTARRLLTQSDKITELELLLSKYRHKNDVFLPDETFYNPIKGPDDLERMADIIFKWLGIKHRSVSFHIDPKQEKLIVYSKNGATHSVTLGWKAQKDSMLCGGLVAHAIVHHVLLGRLKIQLETVAENEELADLGTIYSGLGILILNSFKSDSPALGSMAPANYVAECVDYFDERRLVTSLWQPYLLPGIIDQQIMTRIPVGRYKAFIQKRIKLKRNSRTHTFILIGLACLFFFSLVALLSLQPQSAAQNIQNQQETVSLLKSQYMRCNSTVARKLQTWDQTDIFMVRQIDADRTRCTSLKNRYNYELAQYEELIRK